MPARVLDRDWTAERALALPDDGNRYEVLDGELFVTPAPTWGHQSVLGVLFPLVQAYVRDHRLGWTLFSPADIVFSPRRLVQPDLFVVPWQPETPTSWTEVHRLLLAVEVLSPGTARADRYRKRAIYQDEGVPEYWIVDASARMVERWRPGDAEPEVLFDELAWRPREEIAPFVLPLGAFFDDVVA